MLRLFNTETREIEPLLPRGKTLKMYTCGPTIYNFAHIGNFRTYVAEDLLRRTLEYFDIPVEQVMNLTDLDDKTIQGALCQKVSLKEFTAPFGRAFFEDIQALLIQPAHHYPAATDYIPEMIDKIEELLAKGLAYRGGNGSIYFAIRKFPSYGRLSHFCLQELKENASGDNDADEYDKEEASDFVLWKIHDPSRDGDIYWESPFGRGRPGWHIECSAMAMKLLGPSIDLHCGGVDNMFPHHENEIAQSEGCTNQRFVSHWFHVEHLLVDHKKMSKSLGNFYTLRDLLERGYSGPEVRYLLLSTHYRMQLNFTLSGMEAAKASLKRLKSFIQRLKDLDPTPPTGDCHCILKTQQELFDKALQDDLNISEALAALFDLVREINGLIDEKRLGSSEKELVLACLTHWNRVLAFLPLQEEEEAIPQEILRLVQRREEARKQRDFSLSDALRQELLQAGYAIEDTPKGARIEKIR